MAYRIFGPNEPVIMPGKGLVVMGPRTNLIPYSNNFEMHRDHQTWPNPVSTIPGPFSGEGVAGYEIEVPNSIASKFHVRNTTREKDYCFWIVVILHDLSASASVTLSLRSDKEGKSEKHRISGGRWSELAVAHRFVEAPVSFECEIKVEPSPLLIGAVRLSVAYVGLEDGLFHTSPIITQSGPSQRAADFCSTPKGLIEQLNLSSASLLVDYNLLWDSSEQSTCRVPTAFTFRDAEGTELLRLFHDPKNKFRIALRYRKGGRIETVVSDVSGHKGVQIYIYAGWDDLGNLGLFVNGSLKFRGESDLADMKIATLFIGNDGINKDSQLDGCLSELQCFGGVLKTEEVEARVYARDSEAYPHFRRSFYRMTPPYELPEGHPFRGEILGPVCMDALLHAKSFYKRRLTLLKAYKEDDYRNEFASFLTRENALVSCEVPSGKGRTDIVLEIIRNSDLRMSTTVRCEFKIWGNGDYKRLPQKPFKYMGDYERYAICLMVSTRKGDMFEEYGQNVLNNGTFPPHAHCINPMRLPSAEGEETPDLPQHFVVDYMMENGLMRHVLYILISPFSEMRSISGLYSVH